MLFEQGQRPALNEEINSNKVVESLENNGTVFDSSKFLEQLLHPRETLQYICICTRCLPVRLCVEVVDRH